MANLRLVNKNIRFVQNYTSQLFSFRPHYQIMIRKLLTHPLTQGLDIDTPDTINLRRKIINHKPFLRRLYREWYFMIINELPEDIDGEILELGSGGGFLKLFISELITSDILTIGNIDIVTDGQRLPFSAEQLRGIVMINVLHHIQNPHQFFQEAERCAKPGGVLVMVEPWVSAWSRMVYKKLHHEPFIPESRTWKLSQTGALSGANGAIPWIIFQRDLARFQLEFPSWKIKSIELHTPIRYVLSGGVSLRSLVPSCTFSFWRLIEVSMSPFMDNLAMFATIVLVKRAN